MAYLAFVGGTVLGLIVGLVLGWATPSDEEIAHRLADIRLRRQVGDGL